jgi:hypothetical protein
MKATQIKKEVHLHQEKKEEKGTIKRIQTQVYLKKFINQIQV